MTTLGTYIRNARIALEDEEGKGLFSLRQVAERIKASPTYLSQIERDACSPPTEATLKALATELKLDPDVLLAMAGRISSELQAIILKRPQLFAQMLSACRDVPDHALLKLVREVRDGDW